MATIAGTSIRPAGPQRRSTIHRSRGFPNNGSRGSATDRSLESANESPTEYASGTGSEPPTAVGVRAVAASCGRDTGQSVPTAVFVSVRVLQSPTTEAMDPRPVTPKVPSCEQIPFPTPSTTFGHPVRSPREHSSDRRPPTPRSTPSRPPIPERSRPPRHPGHPMRTPNTHPKINVYTTVKFIRFTPCHNGVRPG